MAIIVNKVYWVIFFFLNLKEGLKKYFSFQNHSLLFRRLNDM